MGERGEKVRSPPPLALACLIKDSGQLLIQTFPEEADSDLRLERFEGRLMEPSEFRLGPVQRGKRAELKQPQRLFVGLW